MHEYAEAVFRHFLILRSSGAEASCNHHYITQEVPMQRILVLLEINEEQQAAFREAAGDNEIVFITGSTSHSISGVSGEELRGFDVIIGQPRPSALQQADNLKWLQASISGVDIYLKEGVLKEGVMLTSATGAYGVTVAEHVFGMMLGIMKRFPAYRDNQKHSLWHDEGSVKSVENANILILGTGDLGSTFAKYCKALGAHTIGVRRDPSRSAEGIDEMHGMDELDSLIRTADVVCTLIPHSEEMTGYFNYDRFMSMKKDAIFLNAGRGTVVDSMGLYRALEEGHLFGVGLDTTAPEPFPADHPLWTQPRAFITPHTAGGDHMASTVGKVAAIALENLKHYLAGEPLRNRKL